MLGIKPSTIRSWARRGKLFPVGLDPHHRPLYDERDLLRLKPVPLNRAKRKPGGMGVVEWQDDDVADPS